MRPTQIMHSQMERSHCGRVFASIVMGSQASQHGRPDDQNKRAEDPGYLLPHGQALHLHATHVMVFVLVTALHRMT